MPLAELADREASFDAPRGLEAGAHHTAFGDARDTREIRGRPERGIGPARPAPTFVLLHRIARIRRHGGRVEERDVVMLGVCLGSVQRTVEVNVVDRSGFDYPVLIGRSFLAGIFVVDPGERFLLTPDCPAPE